MNEDTKYLYKYMFNCPKCKKYAAIATGSKKFRANTTKWGYICLNCKYKKFIKDIGWMSKFGKYKLSPEEYLELKANIERK